MNQFIHTQMHLDLQIKIRGKKEAKVIPKRLWIWPQNLNVSPSLSAAHQTGRRLELKVMPADC